MKSATDVMKGRVVEAVWKGSFMVLVSCLAAGWASTASAATTWKRLGVNPFSQPSLSSEAELKSLVRNRGGDLKDGFSKAGNPDLYPAFMEQFPTAKIDSVKVAPGATFEWVLFKKKATGRVAVIKDVTWKGAAPFEAYRFTIDKDGKRHEFVVPFACGNVALRNVGPIPPAPVAVAAPAPSPAAPAPVAPPAPPSAAPVATAAPAPAYVAPKPVPVAPPEPAPVAPRPVAAAPPVPAAAAPKPVVVPPAAPVPVAPKPVAAAPAPTPAAKSRGGPLFDVGLSRQPDPANYLFVRVGYELPLSEKLYLMGLLGGSLRWMGSDGGSAFTADAILDYHWMDRLSVGAGVGFWSGNDGQLDLIADVGYLLYGHPDGGNASLFLEARLPVDELDSPNEYGRLGLGLRFRL